MAIVFRISRPCEQPQSEEGEIDRTYIIHLYEGNNTNDLVIFVNHGIYGCSSEFLTLCHSNFPVLRTVRMNPAEHCPKNKFKFICLHQENISYREKFSAVSNSDYIYIVKDIML
jgi:hypothetical protein